MENAQIGNCFGVTVALESEIARLQRFRVTVRNNLRTLFYFMPEFLRDSSLDETSIGPEKRHEEGIFDGESCPCWRYRHR